MKWGDEMRKALFGAALLLSICAGMSLVSAGPLRLKAGPRPEGAMSREGPPRISNPDTAVGRDNPLIREINRDRDAGEPRDPLSEDRRIGIIHRVSPDDRLSKQGELLQLMDRERRNREEVFEQAKEHAYCDNHKDSPLCEH
jgi:hypothetical protein